MKKKNWVIAAVVFSGLTGCTKSNDYMPPADASGETIFNAACVTCHKPDGGSVMMLSAKMANVDAIAHKVLTGSMGMPAFPNLQGDPGKRLAEYVLSNSKTKP